MRRDSELGMEPVIIRHSKRGSDVIIVELLLLELHSHHLIVCSERGSNFIIINLLLLALHRCPFESAVKEVQTL